MRPNRTHRLVVFATIVIGARCFVRGLFEADLLFTGGHGRAWGLDGHDARVRAGGPAGEVDVDGYDGFDGFDGFDGLDGLDGFDDDCGGGDGGYEGKEG